MLERFWAERIEDFDLRNKIGMEDTLGTEQVQSLLQQVAELTDGLSGRSLMQLMNGIWGYMLMQFNGFKSPIHEE